MATKPSHLKTFKFFITSDDTVRPQILPVDQTAPPKQQPSLSRSRRYLVKLVNGTHVQTRQSDLAESISEAKRIADAHAKRKIKKLQAELYMLQHFINVKVDADGYERYRNGKTEYVRRRPVIKL